MSVVVASVPSGHVDVRHLEPVDGGGATRLADPVTNGRHEAARWWPPVMLRPEWVRPQWRADPAARRAEREAVSRAHDEPYQAVLERTSLCTSS